MDMTADQLIQSTQNVLPSSEELESQARAMLSIAGDVMNDPAMNDPSPTVLLRQVRLLAHFVLAGRELLEVRRLSIGVQSYQQSTADATPELSGSMSDAPTAARVTADETSLPDPTKVEKNKPDEDDGIDSGAPTIFELPGVGGTEPALTISIDADGQHFTVGEHKFGAKSSDRKQAVQLLKVLAAHPGEWLTRQDILDRGFYGYKSIGVDSKKTIIGIARTQLVALFRDAKDPQLAQLLEERVVPNSKLTQYRFGGNSDQEGAMLNDAEQTPGVTEANVAKTNRGESNKPAEVGYAGVLQMTGKDIHLNGQTVRLKSNERELLIALLEFKAGASRHDLNECVTFLNGRSPHAQDVPFSSAMRGLRAALNSVIPEILTHTGPTQSRLYLLNVGEVKPSQDATTVGAPNSLEEPVKADSSQPETVATASDTADTGALAKAIVPEPAAASVVGSRPNQGVDQVSLPREARLVMSQFTTRSREMKLTEITQAVHNREEVSAAQSVEVLHTVVGLVAGGHLKKRPNGSYVVPSSHAAAPTTSLPEPRRNQPAATAHDRFVPPPPPVSRPVKVEDVANNGGSTPHQSPEHQVDEVPKISEALTARVVEPDRPRATLHVNGLVVREDIEPFNRGEIKVIKTLRNFPSGEVIHETDFVDTLFDQVTRDSRKAFAQNVMPLLARLEAAGLVKIHRRSGGKTFELLADIHEEI